MDGFFQIIGMIAVGVLALGLLGALAVVWFFRRKVEQALSQIIDATMEAPPRRLHLSPTPDPEWSDADTALDACQLFRAAGFEEAGDYVCHDFGELRISAWVHVEQRLYGVVYDHPQAGIFGDVVGFFEDGGSLTVSNAPDHAQLEEPPEHPKILDSSLEIDELIEGAQSETAGRALRATSPADFRDVFEQAYARGTDWRNARGGPSVDEIRRIAEGLSEDVDPVSIEKLHECYVTWASEQLAESCLDFFMDETLLSVAEWEKVRDAVVVIHDHMSGQQVVDAFANCTDLPDALADDLFNLEPTGTPPREFFRHLNLRLDEPLQYRLLGSVQEPVAADIYAGTAVY